MTQTEQHACRKCKRCKEEFIPAADDLLFCNDCRALILMNETGRHAAIFREKEARATAEYFEADFLTDDYKIVDENGELVWAKKVLAARYRAQTKPRGVQRR